MNFVSLRSRCTLLPLVFLFCFGLPLVHKQAYAGVAPRNLQTINLDRTPDVADLTTARTAFRNGSAIIRIIGATRDDLARLLQVQLAEVDAATAASSSLIPLTERGKSLKLQGVAVYLDGAGVVRSLQTFAPENLNETSWRNLMEKWTTREISRTAGALSGDPASPAQAWTTLSVTTMPAAIDGGSEGEEISVLRLNTTDPASDYYMLYTVPTVTPAWDDQCDGIFYCGWHTHSGLLVTSMANALLTNHGPASTIGSSTVGFTIGGSIGPTGPGASATFGVSWTQPDVTTDDLSNSGSGGG